MISARVKQSVLRNVAGVACGVAMMAAGALVGIHVNPELGATLIAAGVHITLDSIFALRPEQRRRRRAQTELALG